MSIAHAHRPPAPARRRIRRSGERGASLVEYALLVALIAVVCIGAVTFLGTSNSDKLTEGGDAVAGSTTAPACDHSNAHPHSDGWYTNGSEIKLPC
jgi:pilus assembly protein Flp/PilA